MNRKRKRELPSTEREAVTLTREYAFPRSSVFKMLTDSKTASQFYTPEGGEKILFKWDARPGGRIRIHDRHPEDGAVYKTSGAIMDLVAPELLVFWSATTSGRGAAPFEALQTVRFDELSPKRTRVTVLVKVLAAGSYRGGVEPLEQGYAGGWAQTLDMLQRALQ